MRTELFLAALIVAVFGGSHLAKTRVASGEWAGRSDSRQNDRPAAFPRRIVSAAPSLTETLFALGLGNRVVGVTNYCNYPPEARRRPKIGALLNPNYEAVVALRPQVVVILSGDEQSLRDLRKLGLRTLVVNHKSIEGILDSFTTIGRACGAEPQAEAFCADIRARLDRVERKLAGRPRPRVLLAVDRTPSRGRLEDVYIGGRDGHLDRILELAGGRNAYQGDVPFPVVSREGMLRMDPQMILDLVPLPPGMPARRPDQRRAILADWNGLDVEAVRQGRVYLVEEDYAFIPGPRFILLVEKLARLIHPEVDWDG
jgi:iron complex transport system substrate-binding protein